MAGSISLFEVPHIVDNIGQYLDKKDYSNCTTVSKALLHQFGRLLWQNLTTISSVKGYSPNDFDKSHKEALLTNACLIRTIATEDIRILELLASPTSACTNLLKLYRYSRVTKHHTEGPEDSMATTASLVEKNRFLRELTIIQYPRSSYVSLRRFVGVLSAHSSITSLDFCVRFRLHHQFYQTLLQNLPDNLETFRLIHPSDGMGGDPNGNMEWDEEVLEEVSKSFPECAWTKSYPRLRYIEYMPHMNSPHQAIYRKFLNHCPALEHIFTQSMPAAPLSDFGRLLGDAILLPKLDRLTLDQRINVDPIAMDPLIMSMKDRIKKLYIKTLTFSSRQSSFIPTMTAHWANTLEHLHISWEFHILSSDVELILAACSKLKVLRIEPFRDNHRYYGDNPVSCLSARHIGSNDWVCLGLQELDISILDSHQGSNPEMEELEEQQTVNGIKRIYQQLGRLTELKKLQISWITNDSFKTKVKLDLSIQSGLGYLRGLKSLEELDVRGIYELKIGQEEAEWIANNWPNLTILRGYIKDTAQSRGCRFAYGIAKADPKYTQWLQAQRPNLKMQINIKVFRLSKCRPAFIRLLNAKDPKSTFFRHSLSKLIGDASNTMASDSSVRPPRQDFGVESMAESTERAEVRVRILSSMRLGYVAPYKSEGYSDDESYGDMPSKNTGWEKLKLEMQSAEKSRWSVNRKRAQKIASEGTRTLDNFGFTSGPEVEVDDSEKYDGMIQEIDNFLVSKYEAT
ncbi:hypothetical protein BGX27_004038 [Mortierella sp. AM989]|nr:hypothetical protein BGX27_004038 [Mortierella sp. AM989]